MSNSEDDKYAPLRALAAAVEAAGYCQEPEDNSDGVCRRTLMFSSDRCRLAKRCPDHIGPGVTRG